LRQIKALANPAFMIQVHRRMCQKWRNSMFKVAVLVWIVLGTTLAGMAVTVVVSIPQLYAQGMTLIPWVAGGGFVVAIPFSFMIAKAMMKAFRT
jgi:hypothetical protein